MSTETPQPSMLDLLKKAQAEALDPQLHEIGAAVKTLDQAMAMLES